MRRLLLPFLVLVAAGLAGPLDWRDALSPERLTLAIRATGVLVFLLAWRFRRGRVAWTALLLTLLHETLGPHRLLDPAIRDAVVDAAAVLVPLNLAVLAFLVEWPVMTTAGALRFGALGLESLGVAWLAGASGAAWLARLRAPLVEAASPGDAGMGEPNALSAIDRAIDVFPLPHLAVGAFLLAAIALAVRLKRGGRAIDAGLAGVLVALYPALVGNPADAAWWLGAATLIVGLSLVENAFSLAFEDGLTGLPARRALDETLKHMGGTYSIAMLDLDHFKKFNDRHGHEIGDQVLQMVASRIAKVGGGGRPFRYGGEEMCILFPGTGAKEAEPLLEDVRRSISDRSFTVRSPGRPKSAKKGAKTRGAGGGTKQLKVTVSIGVAERDDKNRLPEEVMKAADKALYRSKKGGRNRVTIGR